MELRTWCFRMALAALPVGIVGLVWLAPAVCGAVGVSVMSQDGAWSWFSDQRAIYRDGAVYAGWVTSEGDIQIGSYELPLGKATIVELETEFGPDDHDYPALYQTSDGRYTAFFSGHAVYRTCNLYHTTTRPRDITSWGERDSTDVNVAGSAGVTYSNPYTIPGETDRIFLFWRGADWKPSYATGVYDTVTADWEWLLCGSLITVYVGRPYVKYAAGEDKIGMVFTNGHPREIPCNIYYAAIAKADDDREAYFSADGTLIKYLSDGPLVPTEADLVFDRLADPELYGDNSWVWDIAFDESGAPVVAFATFLSKTHHQYHWARYDGNDWEDVVVVADAGGSVADTTVGNPQHYYSGGIALDPLDPNITYVSVVNALGGSDLEQRRREASGGWSVLPIAGGTSDDNMRPIVPRDRPADTELVLWMSGHYDYYANTFFVPARGGAESKRILPVPNGEFATELPFRGTPNYDTDIMLWDCPAQASVVDDAPALVPGLHQASPNPFRTDTHITFELHAPAQVRLCIYDVAGRRVRSVVDGPRTAGVHTAVWDGRGDDGSPAACGVYFVRLIAGDVSETRRCVFVR